MADGRETKAPGQLGLVQAFLNTYDRESGRDDLANAKARCGNRMKGRAYRVRRSGESADGVDSRTAVAG